MPLLLLLFPESTSTSAHDLHANLPLFVTGPAIVQATSGAAWCHGWRIQSVQEGDKVNGDDASAAALTPATEKRLDLNHLAVPAGAVARLEAAPLGPADVPLTARSCRVSVTVPKMQSSEDGKPSPSGAVSRAIPQGGATGATATAPTPTPTLPPPPPASWRAAAASIASCAQASLAAGGGPPSVVVVGPKNVGKSSFARLLANELLSCSSCRCCSPTGTRPASASPAVVAWCDADCGQPELTPPGLVSLSHLSRPLLAGGGSSGGSRNESRSKSSSKSSSENGFPLRRLPHRAARAHFLGALSPASDPDRACAAVASLLRWHWQHGVDGAEAEKNRNTKKKKMTKPFWPPLVVNTPGWVRGAGLDLLRATLAAARPTHVVRLSTGNGERDAPPAFELFEGGRLPPLLEVVELPALTSNNSSNNAGDGDDDDDEGLAPAPSSSLFQGIFPASCASASSSSRYSAADARTALWFAFARSCVESAAADDEEEEEKETSNSSSLDLFLLPAALAAARPMTLPLSSVRLEFLGERPSSPSNALKVLNGSVVALTTAAEAGRGVEDGDDDGDGDDKEEQELALSASPSPAVSLALVRGIDGKRGLLHLLCPLRSAELASAGVVALQVGSALELPPALLAGGVVGVGLASARNGNSEKTPVAVSSSPYLAPWCLAAGGTGARATKARNDLARGGGGGGARN